MSFGSLVSPGHAVGSGVLAAAAERSSDDYLFERFPEAFDHVSDFITLLTAQNPLLALPGNFDDPLAEAKVDRMIQYTHDIRADVEFGHPMARAMTGGGDSTGWRRMRTGVFLCSAVGLDSVAYSEKSARDAGDSLVVSGAAFGVVESWDNYPISGKESAAVLSALCRASVVFVQLWLGSRQRAALSVEPHPESAD